jgi:hypothetical protein
MRYGISLLALVFALSVSTASLHSQGGGKAQAHKPVAGSTHGGGKKADQGKPVTAKAPTAPKTTATVKTKAPKAESVKVKAPEAAKAPKAAKTTTATSTSASTTTTTPTGEVTPTTPTTTRVKNPKLEARLLKMLPGVTDIRLASQDFKNWGQFVAAVHASNRLGIPFETLKAKMTGITPVASGSIGTPTVTTPMSLGQAVQSLKGTATTPETTTLSTTQIQTEVKKAEDAATVDLRRTREGN